MSKYASGKNALGICDRCGFTYRLKQLQHLIVAGVRVSTRVCPECWEPDQPQLLVGRYPVYDPQSLRDPRPDSGELAASRGLRIPVRQTSAHVSVGKVTAVAT